MDELLPGAFPACLLSAQLLALGSLVQQHHGREIDLAGINTYAPAGCGLSGVDISLTLLAAGDPPRRRSPQLNQARLACARTGHTA